jgi:hypothetical protein
MPTQIDELLHSPLVVINVGVQMLSKNLEAQGAEVVQVDWTPPAGGDEEMLDLLDQLL